MCKTRMLTMTTRKKALILANIIPKPNTCQLTVHAAPTNTLISNLFTM